MSETIFTCNNLDEAIEQYNQLGYRLDMIFPADAPREAIMSRDGERVRLVTKNHPVPMETIGTPLGKEGSWKVGRAGMEYRDLIPDRLGGRLIASHIRLTKGGEVPDYVHYHKVEFQMIYCKKGRIRVAYEAQGEPFWLETGDCVLQPPEIRHRVLECTAGAEVIEVTMPAEHETWVDHNLKLPNDRIDLDRIFNGQRFVYDRAADSRPTSESPRGFEVRDLAIAKAPKGVVALFELRTFGGDADLGVGKDNEFKTLYFLLEGGADLTFEGLDGRKFKPDEAILIPPKTTYRLSAGPNTRLLQVLI